MKHNRKPSDYRLPVRVQCSTTVGTTTRAIDGFLLSTGYRSGRPRPTVICCEVADKNQYNKLLGIVRNIHNGSRVRPDMYTTLNYLAF